MEEGLHPGFSEEQPASTHLPDGFLSPSSSLPLSWTLCSALWSGPLPVWPSRGCFCASLVLNSSQSALTAFHDRVSALSEKPHLMPREKGPLPTTCMSVPAAINIPGKQAPGHILLATPGLRVLVSSLTQSS